MLRNTSAHKKAFVITSPTQEVKSFLNVTDVEYERILKISVSKFQTYFHATYLIIGTELYLIGTGFLVRRNLLLRA